jgi:hypothetical protein
MDDIKELERTGELEELGELELIDIDENDEDDEDKKKEELHSKMDLDTSDVLDIKKDTINKETLDSQKQVHNTYTQSSANNTVNRKYLDVMNKSNNVEDLEKKEDGNESFAYSDNKTVKRTKNPIVYVILALIMSGVFTFAGGLIFYYVVGSKDGLNFGSTSSSGTATKEKFIEYCSNNNMEVSEMELDNETKGVLDVYLVKTGTNETINLMVFEDKYAARKFYIDFAFNISKLKEKNAYEFSEENTDYGHYELQNSDKYYYTGYIDNSIICIEVNNANKQKIKEMVNELGFN